MPVQTNIPPQSIKEIITGGNTFPFLLIQFDVEFESKYCK